jgi:hypothetical protein
MDALVGKVNQTTAIVLSEVTKRVDGTDEKTLVFFEDLALFKPGNHTLTTTMGSIRVR